MPSSRIMTNYRLSTSKHFRWWNVFDDGLLRTEQITQQNTAVLRYFGYRCISAYRTSLDAGLSKVSKLSAVTRASLGKRWALYDYSAEPGELIADTATTCVPRGSDGHPQSAPPLTTALRSPNGRRAVPDAASHAVRGAVGAVKLWHFL